MLKKNCENKLQFSQRDRAESNKMPGVEKSGNSEPQDDSYIGQFHRIMGQTKKGLLQLQNKDLERNLRGRDRNALF